MKIDLKNIRHSQMASHETNCYSASIYVDGKKAGTVENGGFGGCDNVHWMDIDFGETVENWAASQPKKQTPYGEMANCLEFIFGELVDDYILTNDLNRKLKKGLIVRDSNTEAHSWRIFTSALSQSIPQMMLNNLIKTGKVRADAVCLNTLPFSDALKLWRA